MQEALSTQPDLGCKLSPHERAFYGSEAKLVVPDSYAELEDLVREAEAARRPLIPAGHGAHAYLGNPPPSGAVVVSLRKLNRVLRYEPGDFTVGAQAGLPLGELRSTLEANNQEIPIDLPAQARGTVGGLVATSPSGLRRGRVGPLRAYVIGAHAMRGGASIYKSGGMVVKNVAGYEVMKLLTGSLGTTGPLLEVNFKLRPIPERRAAHVAVFSDRGAAWRFAEELRTASLETTALWILSSAAREQLQASHAALSAEGEVVFWLFEGHSGRVAWQERQAEALLDHHAPESRSAVSGSELDLITDSLIEIDSPGPEPRADLGIVRLSTLPTRAASLEETARRLVVESDLVPLTASDVLSGLTTLRWTSHRGQAEPDGTASTPDLARPIRALRSALLEHHAAGTLLYLPPDTRASHSFLLTPDPNAGVARKLLHALDPQGIFCPNRLLEPQEASARSAPETP